MSDTESVENSVIASASAYKQCPDCGFATSVILQQCPQCGHRFRTPVGQAGSAPQPTNRTSAIGCINCGNHDVLKLSAFRDAESDAIAHIVPPLDPEYIAPNSTRIAAGVGIMFLLSLMALAATQFSNRFYLIVAGLFAIAAAATGAFAAQETAAAKQQYNSAHAHFEEQIKQWNLLFYCPKCDTVYNLITQKSAPAREVNTLLRRTEVHAHSATHA